MTLKRSLARLLYGYKCDSETYIKYLREHGCTIGEGVHFYSPRTTTVDEVKMDWISIGSYTKITSGVIILAHDYSPSVLIHTHNNVLLSGGKYTTIGNNCFIGMNAIILSGRKIGDNCIVGAGAVVTTDIPDNSVCVGNPAKVIMSLDEYNKKQQRNYMNDAKRNVQHFVKNKKRNPTIEELKGFSFLFVKRTKENWEKYYANYLSHDNAVEDVKRAFFETDPVFSDYDSFMKYCLDDIL